MILWSLDETARQLGNVSKRTVQRLVARKELPMLRIGRLVRIPEEAVRAFVAKNLQAADNGNCAEPKAWKGTTPCRINAKIHRSGMPVIPTQAAQELDGLLKQLTGGKQGRSKQNGD